MTGTGDERPSVVGGETHLAVREALLERLRTMSWPRPERDAAARAFERFTERLDEYRSSPDDA